jgi:hypothetical protein
MKYYIVFIANESSWGRLTRFFKVENPCVWQFVALGA